MLLNCGVGEDSWESLGLQRNQSWIFIGRTDTEAGAPILWPPDAKSWLIRKDPDIIWQRFKAGGEGDERGQDCWMASLLNGHESEQAPRDGEGQESLACYGPWDRQEWDMTEWLNNGNNSLLWVNLNKLLKHFKPPHPVPLLSNDNSYFMNLSRGLIKVMHVNYLECLACIVDPWTI